MIWLIGSNGLLGSEVANQLKIHNLEFVSSNSNVDIANIDSLNNFVANKKIDYIINCAAYTNVDKAETNVEAAKQLNVTGPINLASIANDLNATLVHISTDYVFDGQSHIPYREDSETNPSTIYGKTKRRGEEEIIAGCSKYYIIRTAWLYGHSGKNFVQTMLNLIETKHEIKVVNDQFGTPTSTKNLADIIIRMINSSLPYGIYHYTDKGKTTWFKFACRIKKLGIKKGLITNKTCKISPCSTEDYPTPAIRPGYSVLSKNKIKNTLHISIPSWKKSLAIFFKTL